MWTNPRLLLIVAGSLCVLLLALCPTGCNHGSSSANGKAVDSGLIDTLAETLETWMTERVPESDIPGMAAVIVDREKIVWEYTMGYLDGSESRRVDPNTLFCIRSLSKTVTALAVLLAVQDGLLDLDTPISEYLPGFTINSRHEEHPERKITLRHLLSHWAGLTQEPPPGNTYDDSGYFQRHIESISRTWLRYPVGYRYDYSNLGFDLAGYILQVQSGRPFASIAEESVFEPLGMTASSFDLDRVERIENRARGHERTGEVSPLRLPEMPSAGLYSSIRDMAKFVQFHLNNGIVDGRRILREDLMDQFHSIQFERPGQRMGYCLGILRQGVSNTYAYSHQGGGRGFGSLMILYPELQYGVVLLVNKDGQDLTGYEGMRTVNGPVYDRYGPTPTREVPAAQRRSLNTTDPRIEGILGRYGGNDYFIEIKDGVLMFRNSSGMECPLPLFEDGNELVGYVGGTSELRFLPARGNHDGSLMISDLTVGNSNMLFFDYNDSPHDPPGPGKEEWREFIGDYELVWDGDVTDTVSIEIRNGYLYLDERKCREFMPGLFFSNSGEAIDFRSDPPTFANGIMKKL